MRGAGILLPVSAMPSPYGIGSFSKKTLAVIDRMAEAGQKYWQILPLGPTGYGDSPYQSFSAFAGNPYFIDLDSLAEEGLLDRESLKSVTFCDRDDDIDYLKLYLKRFTVLGEAFQKSDFEKEEAYARFEAKNAFWLEDYALFMSIKNSLGGKSWHEWPDDIRLREKDALEKWSRDNADQIRFYKFLQYEFDRQWRTVKKHANDLGIRVVGDIPIYVAPDSSDAWAEPDMFQFDEDRRPVAVAGCPPDAFSADGQLWGNPLYDWEYHKKTGFAWWKKRIEHCLELYDVVRIDHFRGFDEYYSIPYGEPTAVNGHWEKGPGMELFAALKENPKMTRSSIIAEDLGFLTDSVLRLVHDTGFPGMKVLEFAFDSRDSSNYLPHNYPENSVVYTGTHDNQTLAAWYWELNAEDRALANDYAGVNSGLTDLARNKAFIRLAMESVADTCIIPMQDYLGLGGEARMNHPSTLGGNWRWRMKEGEFTSDLAAHIRRLTRISGR